MKKKMNYLLQECIPWHALNKGASDTHGTSITQHSYLNISRCINDIKALKCMESEAFRGVRGLGHAPPPHLKSGGWGALPVPPPTWTNLDSISTDTLVLLIIVLKKNKFKIVEKLHIL